MNIDEILKYSKPKETYYDILGCHQSSSTDQIIREYKIKALQLHPDKNPDPESVEKFRKLQTAKETLTDDSSRRSYDCWLSSGIHIPFEQWRARKGHSMHWSTPRQTRLGIQYSNSTGQGTDLKVNTGIPTSRESAANESLLDKFRRYEI